MKQDNHMVAILSDRPSEPHSTGEDPEQWAEIAAWESDRADKAEAKALDLEKALTRLKRVINGVSKENR